MTKTCQHKDIVAYPLSMTKTCQH